MYICQEYYSNLSLKSTCQSDIVYNESNAKYQIQIPESMHEYKEML